MDAASEIATGILLLIASAFLLLAGLAIVRFPDLFMRMAASSKAISLGAAVMFLAVAAYFHDTGVTARALAGIGFFLVTAPIGAHLIGRTGWHVRVPFYERTLNQLPPPPHARGPARSADSSDSEEAEESHSAR